MSNENENGVMPPRPIGNAGQAASAQSDGTPTEAHRCKVVAEQQDGANFIITLESDSVEHLLTAQARQLAYAQRFKHGYASAGIDAGNGTYVPPEELEAARKEDRSVELWRIDFVLTPGL